MRTWRGNSEPDAKLSVRNVQHPPFPRRSPTRAASARFRDSQTAKIKKGGTVENAIAYELDDVITPVDLVASENVGMDKIGKVAYTLK
jgi:hypothetical protein